MNIFVTSDLHLPAYLKDFYNSLKEINEKIDIIILCGDIIDNKEHIYLKKLYFMIKEKFGDIKIFATFGNNEASFFPEGEKNKEFYKKEYPFIIWLDYEYYDTGNYYLLGFEGFTDRTWKIANIENLKKIYINRLEEIIKKLDKKIILFSHYGLTKETVFGDPAPLWSLYSKDLEDLLRKYSDKILIAFHGHSHHSLNYKTKINNTEIYNVAFSIHKKPLLFKI
ncbi:MAG: metallophosphoesterase family protein [Nanopusillaceae archaeon]